MIRFNEKYRGIADESDPRTWIDDCLVDTLDLLPIKRKFDYIRIPFIWDKQETYFQMYTVNKTMRKSRGVFNYLLSIVYLPKPKTDKKAIKIQNRIERKMREIYPVVNTYFLYRDVGQDKRYHFHCYIFSSPKEIFEFTDQLKFKLGRKKYRIHYSYHSIPNIEYQTGYFGKPIAKEYNVDRKDLWNNEKVILNLYKSNFEIPTSPRCKFMYYGLRVNTDFIHSKIPKEIINQLNNEELFFPRSRITFKFQGDKFCGQIEGFKHLLKSEKLHFKCNAAILVYHTDKHQGKEGALYFDAFFENDNYKNYFIFKNYVLSIFLPDNPRNLRYMTVEYTHLNCRIKKHFPNKYMFKNLKRLGMLEVIRRLVGNTKTLNTSSINMILKKTVWEKHKSLFKLVGNKKVKWLKHYNTVFKLHVRYKNFKEMQTIACKLQNEFKFYDVESWFCITALNLDGLSISGVVKTKYYQTVKMLLNRRFFLPDEEYMEKHDLIFKVKLHSSYEIKKFRIHEKVSCGALMPMEPILVNNYDYLFQKANRRYLYKT